MTSRNHKDGRFMNELQPIGDWLIAIMGKSNVHEQSIVEASGSPNLPNCTKPEQDAEEGTMLCRK